LLLFIEVIIINSFINKFVYHQYLLTDKCLKCQDPLYNRKRKWNLYPTDTKKKERWIPSYNSCIKKKKKDVGVIDDLWITWE